jgi:pilus assembly protein CpaC
MKPTTLITERRTLVSRSAWCRLLIAVGLTAGGCFAVSQFWDAASILTRDRAVAGDTSSRRNPRLPAVVPPAFNAGEETATEASPQIVVNPHVQPAPPKPLDVPQSADPLLIEVVPDDTETSVAVARDDAPTPPPALVVLEPVQPSIEESAVQPAIDELPMETATATDFALASDRHLVEAAPVQEPDVLAAEESRPAVDLTADRYDFRRRSGTFSPLPETAQPADPFTWSDEPATMAMLQPGDAAQAPAGDMPFEIIEQSHEISVYVRRNKLLKAKSNIFRTAVVDPQICNVVQFTPNEVSVIGLSRGATHVTFWFEGDQNPVTYLVRVEPDPDVQIRRKELYQVMEDTIAQLYPDSKVKLLPVFDKLLVKGQAKDSEEAAQILTIIRNQAQAGAGGAGLGGAGWGLTDGTATDPTLVEQTNRPWPSTQIVNLLRVPGEQQVALRVKIAELNRSAARGIGVDLDMSFEDGNVLLQSMLNAASGNAPSVIGSFDGDQISFGIHYLEQRGVVRLLSEPTLVTLSGRPASFVAGGEFAVPTTVGVGGASAVTTDFRAFGAIISFLPIIVDKDRIRLEVSPEFSQVNNDLEVNNIPGLNTRSVTTTVEMREGQTLAVAGLLDDAMSANTVGNVPLIARWLGGRRNMSHRETELIILVTPELVHAMEAEEVPPLPGFDVTEPTNWEFFIGGRLEGVPTRQYRSSVWPSLRRRYMSGGPAMISGPFGHGQ